MTLTAAKNAARVNVVGALRQNAAYVQMRANQNLPMLLSSGFYANSTNRAQSPLPQPVIELVDNYQTTQLLLRVVPVTNAKAYEVQLTNGTNPPVDAGTFTAGAAHHPDGIDAGNNLRRADARRGRQQRLQRMERPRVAHRDVKSKPPPGLRSILPCQVCGRGQGGGEQFPVNLSLLDGSSPAWQPMMVIAPTLTSSVAGNF